MTTKQGTPHRVIRCPLVNRRLELNIKDVIAHLNNIIEDLLIVLEVLTVDNTDRKDKKETAVNGHVFFKTKSTTIGKCNGKQIA